VSTDDLTRRNAMRKLARLLGIRSIMICPNGHVYNGDDYQSCPDC
jgi:hypothetical protein